MEKKEEERTEGERGGEEEGERWDKSGQGSESPAWLLPCVLSPLRGEPCSTSEPETHLLSQQEQ